MLDIQVRHQLDSFVLDATLSAPPGRVTVLVGESGAGKSTLLGLVAGLLEPDHGRIALNGQVLCDRSHGRFVRPETRPIGYVAQDYALFPHLNVRENIAFGLRSLKLGRAEMNRRTSVALDRFGLAEWAARKPRQLSGGQQQRVALARALVLDPAVLLLDEPLSALDLVTRRQVRSELRRTLESLACITLLVTHHPSEALAFGDQIAVLENGRISQCGTRTDFLRHPSSQYVAEFLGVNLFEGQVVEQMSGGLARVAVGAGHLTVPDPGRGGPVRVLVHPNDIVVSREAPAGSARNALPGAIEELIPEPPAGERVRVIISTQPPLAAEITQHAVEALGLRPGDRVFASFKATRAEILTP